MSSDGSLSFLSAIPSAPELVIPSHLIPIVVTSALGAPFPLHQPRFCLCKQELDQFGHHLSTCHYRAPQGLHDRLSEVVCALARFAGHHVSPASYLLHLNPDKNTVPDFKISSSFPAGRDMIVDLQVRNPCAPSAFDSVGNSKPILAYSEQAKTSKHQAACLSVHADLIPFIIDRFGSFSSSASSLFNCLINEIPGDIFVPVNWSARTASAYWHQRFSVSLWAGAAREMFCLSLRAHHP
jgi:hypothetical protein